MDSKNIYNIISNLPNQILQAFAEVDVKIFKSTKKIIFCGMGGSALPADLLKSYAATLGFQSERIHINRDYSLPAHIDKKWRGFFCSYSGNTAETLSCLCQAERINMKEIVIFSHDGELKKIAAKKEYSFIQIPNAQEPRFAYGYIWGALLKIMSNSKLIKLNFNKLNADIEKIISLKNKIEEQGKKLAQMTQNKTPLVYSSNQWSSVAKIWKINFNETAKIPAFCNVFPELTHNELAGFTNSIGNYQIIILRDENDAPKIKKSMDIFKAILNGKLNVKIINMEKGSSFFKIIFCLWLGLWASYYLAILNGIDPAPVKLVEEFKKSM